MILQSTSLLPPIQTNLTILMSELKLFCNTSFSIFSLTLFHKRFATSAVKYKNRCVDICDIVTVLTLAVPLVLVMCLI